MNRIKSQNKWEELYKKGYRARYPNEDVVRFIQRHFPDREKRRDIKILDFGCGTGRHVIYLAKEDFLTYGIDTAKSGMELTGKWLNNENLKANLKKTEGIIMSYPSNFFDAIIDCASLQHNKLIQIKKIISEMYRILKPSGYIFSYCKSKRDFLFNRGRKLENNSFYIKNFADTPTIIHFFGEKEIRLLWKKFSKIEIEYTERTLNQMASKTAHFIVDIKK